MTNRHVAARLLALSLALVAISARRLSAQDIAAVANPAASFMGHVVSAAEGYPVAGAELRLLPLDSVRTNPGRAPTLFVDSMHTRVSITDSAGSFAIRQLGAGSYLFQVRRIGFAPVEGAVTVDTAALRVRVPLQTLNVLSRILVTESAIDKNTKYLTRMGYSTRSKSAFISKVAGRDEIEHHVEWVTVGDYLQSQDIREARVLLDGMGVGYDDVRNYPINQVLAIEVYRGQLPIDLEMMWSGGVGGAVPKAGSLRRPPPAVVIWSTR